MNRTNKQNSSLWLYFSLLADELNNSGYDMKVVLKPEVDISWNKDTVHDYLWLPIQDVMLKKDSTTKLESKEIDKVYDILNRHISEKFGITVPFPSNEEQYSKSRFRCKKCKLLYGVNNMNGEYCNKCSKETNIKS